MQVALPLTPILFRLLSLVLKNVEEPHLSKLNTDSLDPKAIHATLVSDQPWLWLNPDYEQPQNGDLSLSDMQGAEARLQRFAPLLMHLFPELEQAKGIIESELRPADNMQLGLAQEVKHIFNTPDDNLTSSIPGRLWVKTDHQLPVAGSIKARGGIYEVLCVAEQLALEAGLLGKVDSYTVLACAPARQLFSQYTLSVGSTGNLGLSIGLLLRLGWRLR